MGKIENGPDGGRSTFQERVERLRSGEDRYEPLCTPVLEVIEREKPASAHYAGAGARETLTTGLVLDDHDRASLRAMMPLDLRTPSRVEADRVREARQPRPHLLPEHPVRNSMASLVCQIEARLVAAAWTLARLPDRERSWVYGAQRNGLDYLVERADRWANAVDPATGEVGFGVMRARPAPPTAREVDEWVEPLTWLHWLSREHARVVFGISMCKRGELRARVKWDKVRAIAGVSLTRQRLAQIFDESVATIAAELVAKAAREMRS